MEKVMNREDQKRAPIYEALEKFRKQRVVPFDVPGHKRGRGNPELVELLGEKCVGIDVNSMKPLSSGIGYKRCGGTCSRCISCRTCISDGGRNYFCGAEHDFVSL